MKITISRAAKILGSAEATVRDQADRGVLPVERTSSGVRLFDEAVVTRIAAERQAKRTAAVRARGLAAE